MRLVRRAGLVNPFTQKMTDTAEVVLDSDMATAAGFNVGVVAKPSPGWSVGAHYRHKVKVDYGGQATFTQIPTGYSELDAVVAGRLPQSPAVETAIEYPSILAFGVARDWTEWTVVADVVFFGWHSFDELRLTFPTEPSLDSVIPENYENSWQFRTGFERRLEEGWAVRLGYHYDRTPVPTESVSPLLPDNDRHGFSLGGSWTSASQRFRVDVGAWYLFLADALVRDHEPRDVLLLTGVRQLRAPSALFALPAGTSPGAPYQQMLGQLRTRATPPRWSTPRAPRRGGHGHGPPEVRG